MRLIFLILLLVPTLSFAKKEPYQVKIIVVDHYDQTPISGVQVILNDESNDTMVTDLNGEFVIENCKMKDFTVQVRDPRLSSSSKYINNKSREDISVSFKVRPSSEFYTKRLNELQLKLVQNRNEEYKDIDTAALGSCNSTTNGVVSEAEFPGGASELSRYIVMQVRYPENSIEMEDQGNVYLSFTINEDGTISEIRIEKGVTKELDREAKRLVKGMPKWIPSYCNYRPIKTRVKIPVMFSLY